MGCGCGRSPTGKCIGWHKLSEEQYQIKKAEYEEKEKNKMSIAQQYPDGYSIEWRKQEIAQANKQQKELGGPKGPEPTRFGDWERKGIASDF